MRLPAPKSHFSVEHVSFAYPGSNRLALRGVSSELPPGEALAIVGPSAAGKSTLARLLLGLWQPTGGKVRLDGAEVSARDRDQFGRDIGYLAQDVELFAGTVADNIARFSEAAPEAIVEAAQQAGVHETILRLPCGYEIEIVEGGANLSAGQWQRIGLARALFGRPRLVVLDEPNFNLDVDDEQALIRAVAATKKDGASVVIVAHWPSVLGKVDKVLVLRNGTMDLFGDRNDIMKQITQSRTVETERTVINWRQCNSHKPQAQGAIL
jgi:ABC-type protease/lipase transport system fused ATPase/permease subunit